MQAVTWPVCKDNQNINWQAWSSVHPQLWDPEERLGVHLRHGRLQLHKLWAGPEQEDPEPAQGWKLQMHYIFLTKQKLPNKANEINAAEKRCSIYYSPGPGWYITIKLLWTV